MHLRLASVFALLSSSLLLAACSGSPEEASAVAQPLESPGIDGAVLTQTNALDHNELVAYRRGARGELTLAGRFDTGGTGTGAGLAAQGAIARAGRWLFVVNAGSNDVTTFDLASGSPVVASKVASGGTTPVSVTANGDLVYVLNAGGAGGIAGFRRDPRGSLLPIAGSAQPVSAASVTPTEISFAPDGDTLVVTERDSATIDTYFVDASGRAHAPAFHPANGPSPFGFAFSPAGELVLSEAARSAAAAYFLRHEVDLISLGDPVPDTQQAACWLVVDPGGRYAFTANAGSGTLSSYRIAPRGQLSLQAPVAGETGAGSHPVDMAFDAHGKLLYALANTAGTITTFQVEGGALTPVGVVDALPASASGLVAW